MDCVLNVSFEFFVILEDFQGSNVYLRDENLFAIYFFYNIFRHELRLVIENPNLFDKVWVFYFTTRVTELFLNIWAIESQFLLNFCWAFNLFIFILTYLT